MEESTTGPTVRDGKDDGSESNSTTEVVSDFSDSEEWISSYSKDLVDIRSPTFQPSLALRLSLDEGSKGIPSPPGSSVPKYLNLVTYFKAVTSPSKSPDRSLEFKPLVPGKKHKQPASTSALPPPSLSSTSVSGPLSTTLPTTESVENVPKTMPQPMASASTPGFPIPGRRFLPHQLPTYCPRVQPPDTVKVMEIVVGPLGALRVAMQAKKRVKVWTRRDTGIRGYLTGFIEAFDKHWNLALRDVDEVFWRKRKPKSFVDCEDQGSTIDSVETVVKVPQSSPPPTCDHKTRSKSKDNKLSPALLTPTKRSKRIAARSRSRNRREILVADCSEDLVNWCRMKMQNLSLKDRPKKSTKSPSKLEGPGQVIKSKSHEKKHTFTQFSQPRKDANGFVVVGVTAKVEIVERHVGQLFVMGNDIVMVETMR